jgi:sterol 24-C-methyltransferase
MKQGNEQEVIRYYEKTESRAGYNLLLHGTKHFGYFNDGEAPWHWGSALRSMEDELGQTLGLSPGSRVLDAGCGVGDVASRMASTQGLRVNGVDILDFNIAEARKRAKERGLEDALRFEVMSYADITYPSSFFDGVYTMETLVHAADASAVLGQFYRVLKPGGRLVLFEYAREADSNMPPEAAEAFREVNRVAAMPSFQIFTYGVLEGMLADTGFRNVATRDLTPNMLPMLASFAAIGWAPYHLARILGKQHKVINAMSAVEFWKYRRYFRYNAYGASK